VLIQYDNVARNVIFEINFFCYGKAMIENLDTTAKQVGNNLIDISSQLEAKMEKWSDVPARPDALSDTECVGFINKKTATEGLNLVVDLWAPLASGQATLRLWGIESKVGDDKIERFNNIQLDFTPDYDQARTVAEKAKK
jgi:hypothetical protein